MVRRIGITLFALVVLFSAGLPARAQANTSPARVYRLESSSTYQTGCFAPCMCPVLESDALRGTFRLVPAATGDVFQFFSVENVRWAFDVPSSPTVHHVVGSGTYKYTLGANGRRHQLTLDLVIDQNATEHFDSGLVPMTSPFPRIDITISINGVYCHDTVFTLHARPLVWVNVGPSAITWIGNPDSSSYDVLRGDLDVLHANGGNLAASHLECLASGGSSTSLSHGAVPSPGHGFYFVARDDVGQTPQTWDEGDPEQVRSRDPALQNAAGSCP